MVNLCAVVFVTFSVLIHSGDLHPQFYGKEIDLIGHSCITNIGTQGKCSYLKDCASSLKDIRRHYFPSVCGFIGYMPIVCCRDKVLLPKNRKVREPGQKSREMCKKYSKYYTSSVCPIGQELMVGCTAASREEFPHMAQVGYIEGGEIMYQCGASLISEIFVLTAGHCLRDRNLGPASFVRVGVTNITELAHAQVRKVQEIIKHPMYMNRKYHDIGLLKVEFPFMMNRYVRPACLFTQKVIPGNTSTASGWGNFEFAGVARELLRKVVLEFFTPDVCNKTYRRDINEPNSELKDGILDDIMICSGSTKLFKDTCQGDSGGPLQIPHNESNIECMYDIIGITSFGKFCGLNLPGVYTRVSAYVGWIEEIVWG